MITQCRFVDSGYVQLASQVTSSKKSLTNDPSTKNEHPNTMRDCCIGTVSNRVEVLSVRHPRQGASRAHRISKPGCQIFRGACSVSTSRRILVSFAAQVSCNSCGVLIVVVAEINPRRLTHSSHMENQVSMSIEADDSCEIRGNWTRMRALGYHQVSTDLRTGP